jgi:hypothetical protein
MRRATNFNPEWVYVPAAKGFLVAMAIGAIASGEVILSLVDVRTGQASVAAHTLSVAPAQALFGAPKAAQLHAQPIVESTMDSGADEHLGAATNESTTNAKFMEPAGTANALTEVGPNDASVKVATPPPAAAAPAESSSAAAAPAESKTTKKPRVAIRSAQPNGPFGFGLGAQYPNRAFGGANRYHASGYGRY